MTEKVMSSTFVQTNTIRPCLRSESGVRVVPILSRAFQQSVDLFGCCWFSMIPITKTTKRFLPK